MNTTNNSASFIAGLKSTKGGKSSWTYAEESIFLQHMLGEVTKAQRDAVLARSPAGFYAKKASLTKLLSDAGATDIESAKAALAVKHGVKVVETEEVA